MYRNFRRTSVIVATSFFAGAGVQKMLDRKKQELNISNCANYLSAELLKRGW